MAHTLRIVGALVVRVGRRGFSGSDGDVAKDLGTFE